MKGIYRVKKYIFLGVVLGFGILIFSHVQKNETAEGVPIWGLSAQNVAEGVPIWGNLVYPSY
jgi:hypothetical protein